MGQGASSRAGNRSCFLGERATYIVQIGTMRFHVRWREYLAQKEGLFYRVYYIPDTREHAESSFGIIAVESLSKV